jgi:hypothetical protein
MSSKLVTVLVIVVLLVVVGMLVTANKGKTIVLQPQQASQQVASQSGNTQSTGTGTIKDLMNLTSAKVCQISNANGSGTLYAGNHQLRFNSSTSHMQMDTQNIYVWSDTGTVGYKLPNIVATSSATQNKLADLNQSYNYSCKDWTVDASVFAIPTSVKFTSYPIPNQ